MSLRICRYCGEERNEKTGACRNGCDHVTARPLGSLFVVQIHGLVEDAPVRTVGEGGLRRLPTTKEGTKE